MRWRRGFRSTPADGRVRCGGWPCGGKDGGVGVEDGLDGPVALSVDADLEPLGVETSHQFGQLGPVEVQDPRAVRRHRVLAADGGGTAAHAAVGPDLHRLGGQPVRPAAPQPGRQQPVHLVVHDQAVDPLVQRAGRVGLGEGGERVAAQIGFADRGDAERGQPFAGRAHHPGPLFRAQLAQVVVQVALEQREHRPLEDHTVEPALVVPAERATGWVRLAVGEPGLPQRGAVQHAGVQARVIEHGRAVRDRGVQVGPGRVPVLPQLVLHVPGAGDPGAVRGPAGLVPQPGHDGRDVRRGRLAAVGRRGQVADIGDVTVRVDQPRDHGGAVQVHDGGVLGRQGPDLGG